MPDTVQPVEPQQKRQRELAAPTDVQTYADAPALAIWFNDALFDKASIIANRLANAVGITPKHLIGKTESCFFIVEMALTWRLSPSYVARNTYQTPGGSIGYFGKLCQAILEASGYVEGGVKFEHYVMVKLKKGDRTSEMRSNDPQLDLALKPLPEGVDDPKMGWTEVSRADWSQVQGKFVIAESQNGKYAKRTWDENKDAVGLGVTVRAKLKGEAEARELHFDLRQAWPLNSTLWATDPRTQICYLAVRRFADTRAPMLFAGLPFDHEYDPAESAIEVNPRPAPSRPTAATVRAAADATEIDPTTGLPFAASDDGAADDKPESAGFVLITELGEEAGRYLDPQVFVDEIAARVKKSADPQTFRDNNADEIDRAKAAGAECGLMWTTINAAVSEHLAPKSPPPPVNPPPPPAETKKAEAPAKGTEPAQTTAPAQGGLGLGDQLATSPPPPPAAQQQRPKVRKIPVGMAKEGGGSDWVNWRTAMIDHADELPPEMMPDLIAKHTDPLKAMKERAPDLHKGLMEHLAAREAEGGES